MPHLLISAAHKSSGKTTLCIGLCAEWRRRGLVVQPFKKGPDYIDPLWLAQAATRPCCNLDFYTQQPAEILTSFATHLHGTTLGLIEGNKGLYDGLDVAGSNSNAALAALLNAPVVLVLDSRGMTRGIAPLLLGYQAFDRNIRIAGVILNQVGGARHESKLRQVIAQYTDLLVLGALHQNPALAIAERHLGLVPSNECEAAARQIESIRQVVAAQVDCDAVAQIAMSANFPNCIYAPALIPTRMKPDVRIGIAMDQAFGFYYPGDLQALEHLGAELIPFSPIRDSFLPSVDGIFIGGGFPEMHMEALESNRAFRQALFDYVEAGYPLYAECGGLMYLARRITWQGKSCNMVGALPANVIMEARPQGRGYVRLKETAACPWGDGNNREIAAHEFHYSRLEQLPPNQAFAFEVLRGVGINGTHDGLIYKQLLASYTHLRNVAGYPWPRYFLAQVRRVKASFQN